MALVLSAGLPSSGLCPRTRFGVGERMCWLVALSLTKLQGSLGVKLPHPLLQEAFLKPC